MSQNYVPLGVREKVAANLRAEGHDLSDDQIDKYLNQIYSNQVPKTDTPKPTPYWKTIPDTKSHFATQRAEQ